MQLLQIYKSIDYSPVFFIILPGIPPIMLSEGKSPFTTAPAATIDRFPITEPAIIVLLAHNQQPLFMVIGKL